MCFGHPGTNFHGPPLDAPTVLGHYHPRPSWAAIHSGLLVRQTSWDFHPGQDRWPPPSLLVAGTGRKYHCLHIFHRAPSHRGMFTENWIARTILLRFSAGSTSRGSHCGFSCALPCCLCVDGNAGFVLCLPVILFSRNLGRKNSLYL